MTTSNAMRAVTARLSFRAGVTRRHVQVGLGVLWLLAAVLQLQPFMFTADFPHQVIAGAANGQPGWVSAGAHWAAHLMAAAPVLTNAAFALIQLALAVAILSRRLVRFGLIASIAWSAGVWYFGESLGGIASGHASLITGAPGAVLFYAALAVLAWPRGATLRQRGVSEVAVAAAATAVWALVWVGAAVLQLLPGQNTVGALADSIRGNADMAPGWLAAADRSISSYLSGAGQPALAVFVAVLVVVGIAALAGGRIARAGAAAGIVLAVAFWLFGQSFGGIGTGQATDPNSGPLLALLAVAVLSATHRPASPAPDADPVRSRARSWPTVSRGQRQLATLAAVSVLATSCVAARAATPAKTSAAGMTMTPGTTMTPGMVMPDGTTMGAASPSPGAAQPSNLPAANTAGPSQSATMVCSAEIRNDVVKILGLQRTPSSTTSWVNHLFTCTYQLPTGSLVLRVHESPTVPAARQYFNAQRHSLPSAKPLVGLASFGLPAFETDRNVVFLKDAKTLEVDATGLPAHVGPNGDTRGDFAYTVATDVLVCWNGG